ncbi:MAG: hypothetical protein ACI8UZ_003446 [Akkermansiaceae bacterium]
MCGTQNRTRRVGLLLLVALSSLLPLQAQDKTRYVPKPTAAENPQPTKAASGKADYSAAFEKLINLGFPDAKGAKYIKLTFAKDDESRDYQRYTIKRSGNAWLLPAEDPKARARTVIHDGFQLAKVATKEKRNLIARLVIGDDDKTREGVRKAEWSEVDAAEEVEEIIEQLDSDQNLNQLFDASSWSYDTSAMAKLGELLMTACHLHRSGQIDPGNKLAHHILSKAPYPFKVIDHVVGELAEAEYDSLLDDLYAKGNWEPFLKGIRNLSTKYPRGWDDQPGVKILITKVVSHLRSGRTKLSPFKGQALDPTIAESLEQLLTPTAPGVFINANSPQCWLINADGEITSGYGRSGRAPEWVAAIIARGMDAFPTLIAASADETLIPAPFSTPSSGSSDGPMFTNGPNEDSDETTYREMSRPCTRGEIARAIMIRTLPGQEANWATLSPEEFQLTAHDWWLENKRKSAGQIAVLFLESGDDQQKPVALEALLASGEESSFPIVEDFILNSGSLMGQVELATQYLQKRRAKGKEFHDTFVAKLREEMDGNYGGQDMAEQIEEYFKETVSGLSVLVNDIPPEKIIAQISSGETTLEDGLPLLEVAIGEGKFLEKLGTLLTFISGLEKSADRLTALSKLQTWTYDDEQSYSEEGELRDSQKELRELASTHLETWKTFLIRKDSLTIDAKSLVSFGSPPTEAHYAAMVMNGLHYPETFEQLRGVNSVASSDEAWELLLARMEKFSKTGQPPVFPAAKNVPEERQHAILTKAKELPTAEIIPYRKSLNLSERLAMVDLIQGLEEVPENIAALARVCQKIDWSRAEDIPQSLRDRIEKMLFGQEISAVMVETTFKTLSKEEIGLILIFQDNNESLNGPRIMGWGTAMSEGWLDRFIEEDLGKLDGKKVKRLEALIAFGIDKESNEPQSAVRFLAPLNEAAEKTAFEELLKESLALFEPSEEENGQRAQAGFVLATATYETHNTSNEEEVEIEIDDE